jgi:hypothetical protein
LKIVAFAGSASGSSITTPTIMETPEPAFATSHSVPPSLVSVDSLSPFEKQRLLQFDSLFRIISPCDDLIDLPKKALNEKTYCATMISVANEPSCLIERLQFPALTLAQQSIGNIHCFVDFSNFWVGLVQKIKEKHETTLSSSTCSYKPACARIFSTLRRILMSGFAPHRVRSCVAVGSVGNDNEQFWQQLRECGYETNLFPRLSVTDSTGRTRDLEVGVDHAMHALILARVLDRVENPASTQPTLILLTGDGNDNIEAQGVSDGFTKTTNFPMCVELALQHGWRVIQYAWSWSCNATFKKMHQQYPQQYQLIFLDSSNLLFAALFGALDSDLAAPAFSAMRVKSVTKRNRQVGKVAFSAMRVQSTTKRKGQVGKVKSGKTLRHALSCRRRVILNSVSDFLVSGISPRFARKIRATSSALRYDGGNLFSHLNR